MSAKRPPSIKRKGYVEIDLDLLEKTGEIKVVSAPIIAPEITSKVPRGKFEIVYTAELFDVMRELGNKKIEVLAWLLDNKSPDNSINVTNTDIAKALGCSRTTVVEAMRTLNNAGLTRRKGSVVMISPGLMVKGNQVREAFLMRKYEEIPETTDGKELIAADVTLDGQLALNMDGDVVQKAH